MRGSRKATIIHVLGIRRYRLRKIWDDEVCRLTQQSGLVLCLGGFLFLPLTLKTLVFDSVHNILNIRPIHLDPRLALVMYRPQEQPYIDTTSTPTVLRVNITMFAVNRHAVIYSCYQVALEMLSNYVSFTSRGEIWQLQTPQVNHNVPALRQSQHLLSVQDQETNARFTLAHNSQ